jgi:F-type H+-transporting ATPase subunit b
MEALLRLYHENAETVNQWFWPEIPAVIVLVAILYVVLKKNLFGPLGEIIEERARILDSAAESEKTTLARHEEAAQTVEEAIRKARAEAARVREEVRARAQKECDALLADARARAERELRENLVQLESEVERGRTALEPESQVLAKRLVARLLEAEGGSA